jgi:hypothetical protein
VPHCGQKRLSPGMSLLQLGQALVFAMADCITRVAATHTAVTRHRHSIKLRSVPQMVIAKCRSGSRTTDLPCPRNVRFSPESDQIAALRQVTFRANRVRMASQQTLCELLTQGIGLAPAEASPWRAPRRALAPDQCLANFGLKLLSSAL